MGELQDAAKMLSVEEMQRWPGTPQRGFASLSRNQVFFETRPRAEDCS